MVSGPSSSTRETIATLREGQRLEGALFACVSKRRLTARTGSPYLAVELRDSTGTVAGRAFRDADLLAGRFERGELVRVSGRVERFREELVLQLESIARADGAEAADPASFLPSSRRDLDELEGFLEHLVREVYDPGLRGLLDSMMADANLRRELRRAPCSLPDSRGGAGGGGAAGGASGWGAGGGGPAGGGGGSNAAGVGGGAAGGGGGRGARGGSHHAFLGGLLEHTVAVASMALELCSVHQRLDRDLLLCAAIVHDIGKTREYTYGAEIARSEEGRLLGHVELGLRLIAEHAPASLRADRRLALEHCVIAHHAGDGPAAAAPRFASAEALALARINALDASVKGAFERGL